MIDFIKTALQKIEIYIFLLVWHQTESIVDIYLQKFEMHDISTKFYKINQWQYMNLKYLLKKLIFHFKFDLMTKNKIKANTSYFIFFIANEKHLLRKRIYSIVVTKIMF